MTLSKRGVQGFTPLALGSRRGRPTGAKPIPIILDLQRVERWRADNKKKARTTCRSGPLNRLYFNL
jgi:hypothetical protein